MPNESTVPNTYNEMVQFINQNDTSVVAKTITENFTSNARILNVIDDLRDRARANEAKPMDMEIHKGIGIGRRRSADALMLLLKDDEVDEESIE